MPGVQMRLIGKATVESLRCVESLKLRSLLRNKAWHFFQSDVCRFQTLDQINNSPAAAETNTTNQNKTYKGQ